MIRAYELHIDICGTSNGEDPFLSHVATSIFRRVIALQRFGARIFVCVRTCTTCLRSACYYGQLISSSADRHVLRHVLRRKQEVSDPVLVRALLDRIVARHNHLYLREKKSQRAVLGLVGKLKL